MSLRKKLLVAGAVFFFLVLLITSFFGRKGLIEIYRAKKNYHNLIQKVEQLKQEKSKLGREIQELEINPKAVEREAREKLWLMKPDEKVIVKKKSDKDK